MIYEKNEYTFKKNILNVLRLEPTISILTAIRSKGLSGTVMDTGLENTSL